MMSLRRSFRTLVARLLPLLPLLCLLARASAQSAQASDPAELDDDEMWVDEEQTTDAFQQSLPQKSMIDAIVIWILLHPTEFAVGCACVLVPLFLLAMLSAWVMIRTMDQDDSRRREEREEEQQRRTAGDQTTEAAAVGASNPQGKPARSNQHSASQAHRAGLTHRTNAAAGATQ